MFSKRVGRESSVIVWVTTNYKEAQEIGGIENILRLKQYVNNLIWLTDFIQWR